LDRGAGVGNGSALGGCDADAKPARESGWLRPHAISVAAKNKHRNARAPPILAKL
jgi:hypothetical protein